MDISTRDFNVEIVGESNYQMAIKAARKQRNSDFIPVYLNREPTNPYDINAVAVMSGRNEHLGYLRRGLAKQYAQVLDEVADAGLRATCRGRLARKSGSRSYGIWIDAGTVAAVHEKLKSRLKI